MAFKTAHPLNTTPVWTRRFSPVWFFYVADNEPEILVFMPALTHS